MNIINDQLTPIQKLKENTNNNSFYMKREDLLPFSFGGNKARKAMLFYADFKNKEADCIVTYGSSSSNHCRIIANIAASNQIPCYIISPMESNYTTSNKYLVDLLGAKVIESPVSEVSYAINQLLEKLKFESYNPYFIQGGGHGNLGTQAYVDAYEEIVAFEKKSQIYFDYIFVTSGTGTTQAGLICGKQINRGKQSIVGISNARKNPYGGNVVKQSVKDYILEKGYKSITDNEVVFVDDYVLEGYGKHNNEILNTIKEVYINEGIPLDSTYTGKAYWGMREFIKNKSIENKNILFIHTGGTPLFFDKLEEI